MLVLLSWIRVADPPDWKAKKMRLFFLLFYHSISGQRSGFHSSDATFTTAITTSLFTRFCVCVCVCVCALLLFFFKDEANRVIEIDKYVDQSKKNRRNAVDELPEAEKKKAPLPLFNQSSTESVCHPNKHSALESVEARNWNVVPW